MSGRVSPVTSAFTVLSNASGAPAAYTCKANVESTNRSLSTQSRVVRAGRMTLRTWSYRAVDTNSSSSIGSSGKLRSLIRTARTSRPSLPPSGSFVRTTRCPCPSSHAAKRPSCVVFPLPSIPSKLTNGTLRPYIPRSVSCLPVKNHDEIIDHPICIGRIMSAEETRPPTCAPAAIPQLWRLDARDAAGALRLGGITSSRRPRKSGNLRCAAFR